MNPSQEPNSWICTPASSMPVSTKTTPESTLVTPSPRLPCAFAATGMTSMIVLEKTCRSSGLMTSMVTFLTNGSAAFAASVREPSMDSVPCR